MLINKLPPAFSAKVVLVGSSDVSGHLLTSVIWTAEHPSGLSHLQDRSVTQIAGFSYNSCATYSLLNRIAEETLDAGNTPCLKVKVMKKVYSIKCSNL